VSLCRHAAFAHRGRVALIDADDSETTFDEFHLRTNQLANALRQRGIGSGDPLLHRESNHMAAARYLRGLATNDPIASPAFADMRGLPPMLIQASPIEALFDDALRLTRRAGECGVKVQLSLWPDEIHVWQLFGHRLPTAIGALREGGAFLAAALRLAPFGDLLAHRG
jgi:acetyl esterase/lipase